MLSQDSAGFLAEMFFRVYLGVMWWFGVIWWCHISRQTSQTNVNHRQKQEMKTEKL